jgi:cytidylate kinase
MAIITISKQIGSLGNEIARELADKLGYDRIEKSQIGAVLSEHGFSASDVDNYDEKNPSLLQHLSIQKNMFEYLIRAAVYEFAAKGNVVIVGRGSQVILKDIPGILHIRVIAPYATRVSRLMEQKGNEKKNVQWVIQQSDYNSSGYIHTYFHADWDDSELYDMVLNTRTMTLNNCVQMIMCTVCSEEFKKSAQMTEELIDLALTQKAKAVMLEVAGLEKPDLVVQNGIACLSGSGMLPEVKEACEKAILKIKGIIKLTCGNGAPAE